MKRSLQETTNHIFNHSLILLPAIYFIVMLISFFEMNVMTVIINSFCIVVVFCALFIFYEFKKKKREYKFWYYLYLFVLYPSFLVLCFFVYSFYWFDYSYYISLFCFALQLFMFFLGFLAGYIRFDSKRQNINLRKTIKLLHRTDKYLDKGVIYLKENSYNSNIFTYKKFFENWVLETAFRIFKYGYITIIGVVFLLGSGSSLIIIRIIDSYIPLGMDISSHHIAAYGFSLIVIPVLAYYLPAIFSAIHWWKDLESDIRKSYGEVVYVWPDEQET